MCQAKVLQQREDGSEVIMGVASHELKPTLKLIGGMPEGEHIHG